MGLIEDAANRTRLAKLLRYATSKSGDKEISLEDYVANMKVRPNPYPSPLTLTLTLTPNPHLHLHPSPSPLTLTPNPFPHEGGPEEHLLHLRRGQGVAAQVALGGDAAL